MAKSTKRRGRGEGSVEELPSGKHRAVLSAGTDPATGERLKLRETFDRKQEALDWLAERRREYRQGTLASSGRLTLDGWLSQWELLKAPKIEPASWDCHALRLPKIRRHLGRAPLARLRALDVERMLGQLAREGESTYEVGRVLLTLRAALNDAVRLRLLAVNPTTGVEAPRHTPAELTCWDAGQVQRFLAVATHHRLAAYWQLALDTGCRPGELLGLHWPDVNLEEGWVYVRQSLEQRKHKCRLKPPKTARGRRRILLTPATVELLKWHKLRARGRGCDTTDGPVFVGLTGGWIYLTNLRETFRTLARRAGLPRIRLYDLRHTSATLLLARGVNVKVVSQRLGHESIQITLKHYAHVLPELQEQARDVLQSLFVADCPTFVPPAARERA